MRRHCRLVFHAAARLFWAVANALRLLRNLSMARMTDRVTRVMTECHPAMDIASFVPFL